MMILYKHLMVEAVETYDDLVHRKLDENILMIGKGLKKEWIELPRNIKVPKSQRRSKVVDQFVTNCQCGNHLTTVYVLEAGYITCHCASRSNWVWAKTGSPESLAGMKQAGDKLIAHLMSRDWPADSREGIIKRTYPTTR